MKNLFFILLILSIASCKKEEFSPNLTKEFSIRSTSNGANYNIKVALPENFNPESKKYATIYVLDGEENFNFVAERVSKAGDDVMVVAIGYGNDRAFDYTPTKANEGGGGAENFMRFIKDELVPKVENEFGVSSTRESRAILGHSFGGLCAAYAFTNYNSVFGNYIILSPSIWYDNEIMLRLEGDNRSINKSNSQLVFMGIGELENAGRMQAPYQAFYQRLKNNYPGIKIKSHIEPHLDHRGSEKPNIIEGLDYYFQNR